MKTIHVLLERVGQITDYYLLPIWRLRHWEFASHLRRLFSDLRINVVLDVGANKGQYHDFLRRHVGYDGPVISFEPIPQNVEVLQQRASTETLWQVQGYALGPTTGKRAFNIMRRNTLSSFLDPDNRESNPRLSEHNSVAQVVEVQVKTLADVWPEIEARYGSQIRPYLKIDTQGPDLQVVEGARPVLSRIVALQTELLLRPLYKGAPSYTDALRSFEAFGFDVAGFFSVSHDNARRLRACDCTMINRNAR